MHPLRSKLWKKQKVDLKGASKLVKEPKPEKRCSHVSGFLVDNRFGGICIVIHRGQTEYGFHVSYISCHTRPSRDRK